MPCSSVPISHYAPLSMTFNDEHYLWLLWCSCNKDEDEISSFTSRRSRSVTTSPFALIVSVRQKKAVSSKDPSSAERLTSDTAKSMHDQSIAWPMVPTSFSFTSPIRDEKPPPTQEWLGCFSKRLRTSATVSPATHLVSRDDTPRTSLPFLVMEELWRGRTRQWSPFSRCRSCAGLPQTSGS